MPDGQNTEYAIRSNESTQNYRTHIYFLTPIITTNPSIRAHRFLCPTKIDPDRPSFPLRFSPFLLLSLTAKNCSMKSFFLITTTLLQLSTDFVDSFNVVHQRTTNKFCSLHAKKGGDEAFHPTVYPVGTFIEFEEKSRDHVGKITKMDHTTSGTTRYHVMDQDGKQYEIADKAVQFAIHPPNSPVASEKLFEDFVAAHDASESSLQSQLSISPEVLEIAWEEFSETEDHLLTPSALVDLVHSHTASALEKYMAWKILRTELAHVFFKEIKDHGRVVAFKAKTAKTVEAAKETFCHSHHDSDLCLV